MSACPCPPPTPEPCPQFCPPPPPPPPCRTKPVMRGLHWAQTTRVIAGALTSACIAGAMVYVFLGTPRRAAYTEYYKRAELEDQAEEMAQKGLFQAVPKAPKK